VPTEVGCGGVRKQIELALTPKERLGLQNSARVLRETIEQVETRLTTDRRAAPTTSTPTTSTVGRTIPRSAWATARK
jgi:hypothetical protein